MGLGRKRKLSEVALTVIARNQAKKTVRRKRVQKENARLRQRGDKFGKRDACYKHSCPECKCAVNTIDDLIDHAKCFCK